MKSIIIDTKCRRPFTLGNVGEREAMAIAIDVPAQYRDGHIYLDFLLPDGTKTQTRALGDDYLFVIPNELLRMRGWAALDIVYKKGDKAGSQGVYELIETITVNEAVSVIQRTKEPDGTAYQFKALRCHSAVAPGTDLGSVLLCFMRPLIFRFGTMTRR
ncbi:MAG: hypothetical protein ACOX0U_10580 [Oscillospiraceae bacterium]|jgi:hypothetical protein